MATTGFYSPGYNSQGGGGYGATQRWETTPEVLLDLDPQIPQGVYTSFLAKNGFGGQDRRGTWARGLYGQTQSGYQAALRENPTLTYHDYLRKQFRKGGLDRMWGGFAPEQRGERPAQWTGPTRPIAWG